MYTIPQIQEQRAPRPNTLTFPNLLLSSQERSVLILRF